MLHWTEKEENKKILAARIYERGGGVLDVNVFNFYWGFEVNGDYIGGRLTPS